LAPDYRSGSARGRWCAGDIEYVVSRGGRFVNLAHSDAIEHVGGAAGPGKNKRLFKRIGKSGGMHASGTQYALPYIAAPLTAYPWALRVGCLKQ
jgi:hypothetical protein